MKTQIRRFAPALIALTALLAFTIRANGASDPEDLLTLTAVNSATIMSNGARPEDPGKIFLNVQGVGKRQFASYAILDFAVPRDSWQILGQRLPTRVHITLQQSNAPFSSSGNYSVWLATNNRVSIEPGGTLTFDTSAGTGGIHPDDAVLGPLVRLRRSVFFLAGSTGEAEVIDLILNGESREHLERQLREGEPIRLVFVAEEEDVAATFFGHANRRSAPPTLHFQRD